MIRKPFRYPAGYPAGLYAGQLVRILPTWQERHPPHVISGFDTCLVERPPENSLPLVNEKVYVRNIDSSSRQLFHVPAACLQPFAHRYPSGHTTGRQVIWRRDARNWSEMVDDYLRHGRDVAQSIGRPRGVIVDLAPADRSIASPDNWEYIPVWTYGDLERRWMHLSNIVVLTPHYYRMSFRKLAEALGEYLPAAENGCLDEGSLKRLPLPSQPPQEILE